MIAGRSFRVRRPRNISERPPSPGASIAYLRSGSPQRAPAVYHVAAKPQAWHGHPRNLPPAESRRRMRNLHTFRQSLWQSHGTGDGSTTKRLIPRHNALFPARSQLPIPYGVFAHPYVASATSRAASASRSPATCARSTRGRRRRRQGGTRGVRRALGRAVPADHQELAGRLGASDPLPRLPARGQTRDPHDERDRSAEPPAPESGQDQGGTSPTKKPHGNSSTSRSATQRRHRPGPATGRQRCSRSRSTSETDCPTKPAYTENRTPSRPSAGGVRRWPCRVETSRSPVGGCVRRRLLPS